MSIQIIDNQSQETSVKDFLERTLPVTSRLDIATGYFEIGSLLLLDGKWQKLDKIRILFGDEVTARTGRVFERMLEMLCKKIDDGLEADKEGNEFLTGVPAIIDAMKSGKIECRVYNHSKFHAKSYILYFNDSTASVLSNLNVSNTFAIVGSSNFTKPGLTQNIELNTQFQDKDDVIKLQDWFNKMWDDAELISDSVLNIIEKHIKEYSPFDVYMRSMYEYYRGQEESISEWEQKDSKVFPILAQYQKDGYNNLIKIANKYGGAFLCDGVGLGKTYIGLMLIERFVKKERRNVVLIVPAAARFSVWEEKIKDTIPEIFEGFYPFKIINHTDLIAESKKELIDQIQNQAEIVIIDEAHHFRNRSSNSYRRLYEVMGNGAQKQLYMLTATPLNNTFLDLQHLIELFTQRKEDHFAIPPLGINSLSGHFRILEKKLQETELVVSGNLNTQAVQQAEFFTNDPLIEELVVQRSRTYVKKSLKSDSEILFPNRLDPIVSNYSLRKSYSSLIDDFIKAFDRKNKDGKSIVLLSLAIYSPFDDEYYHGPETDKIVTGRQQQVVSLVRLLMLKRFESSSAAFLETCVKIFLRLKKFIDDYKEQGSQRRIEKFYAKYQDIFDYISEYLKSNDTTEDEIDEEFPDYVWNVDNYGMDGRLIRLDVKDFDIPVLLEDTMDDIDILAQFINDIRKVRPEDDDKINTLINTLKNDQRIKDKKLIIFSEYTATAKYIEQQLKKAGFSNIQEIDGSTGIKKKDVIKKFAPYYNYVDPSTIAPKDDIKILVATDVLAEGLNLQDAQCLINYEIHWNPVRLMQRIGRIDRRRDKTTEDKILADHPELTADRANAYIWNFLPPGELNELLSLYKRVTQKTLRISLVFGIEGKKLLSDKDDYQALKDFNAEYEGKESKAEEMALAYQELLEKYPDYEANADKQPKRIYSGKFPAGTKGIFFCFKMPSKDENGEWTVDSGLCKWLFLNTETDEIIEDTYKLWKIIECMESEPRAFHISKNEFDKRRRQVQRPLKQYMRQMQVPISDKYDHPLKEKLVTWLQVE